MNLHQAAARLSLLRADRRLDADTHEVRTLVTEQRDALASALCITPDAAMKLFDEDALTAIADSAADALAGEEPGRPPWERPDTHMLPVPTAAGLTWSLLTAAMVDPEHARGPLDAAAVYQRRLMEGAPAEPIGEIAVPAQVLNWTARLLEMTANQERLFQASSVHGNPAETRRILLTQAAEARRLALSPASLTPNGG